MESASAGFFAENKFEGDFYPGAPLAPMYPTCLEIEGVRSSIMSYLCRRTRVTEASELETAAAIATKDGQRKIIYLSVFICHIIPCYILHNISLSLLSKTDIPAEEKTEIELLEQVLKKALKIRSTSEAHKELHSDSNRRKHPNGSKTNVTVKEEDKRKPVKSFPPSETSKKPSHHRGAARVNVTHGAVLLRKGSSGHPVFKGRPSVPKSAPVIPASQQKMCVKATNADESSSSVSCQDGKFTTGYMQNAQWYVCDQIFIFVAAKYEIYI